jgi:hypothetical protein
VQARSCDLRDGEESLFVVDETVNMVLQAQEKEILIAALSFLFLAMVMTAVYRADYVKPQLHLPTVKLSQLKTGDLLLFNTSYEMFTDMIKLIVGCPYVHVGIAFIDAAGRPFVFEVCTNGRGNQFNALDVRLKKENELVVVRQLNKKVSSTTFEKIALTLMGMPYSYNVVPIVLRSWLRPFMMIPTARTNVLNEGRVCTQLVADMYEKLGIFDMNLNDCGSDAMSPKDFSQDGDRMPLTNRYHFYQEKRVVL